MQPEFWHLSLHTATSQPVLLIKKDPKVSKNCSVQIHLASLNQNLGIRCIELMADLIIIVCTSRYPVLKIYKKLSAMYMIVSRLLELRCYKNAQLILLTPNIWLLYCYLQCLPQLSGIVFFYSLGECMSGKDPPISKVFL